MNYHIKDFSQLTTKELYEILRLRSEIFVVEQNCAYQDIDSKDDASYHLYFEDHGAIVTYLRILPKGISYPETSIGRVLTKPAYRKQGLSKELVQRAIDYITEVLGEREIKISAQSYLQKFYKSVGFETTSDIYLEDGIAHIEMVYKK